MTCKSEKNQRSIAPSAAPNEARRLLRAGGKRMTIQRSLLLRLVQESDSHLDADELYRRARKRDPRINLTTVYRTLNLLKEFDLVEHRFLSHEHRGETFEIKPSEEHYHFTCVRCKNVIEFESPLVGHLRSQIKNKYGVEFTHACLCFEGYCANCAGERN
jgi:Fe2+ or Zn2+ uptake regulation protein